jgi:hypothetical protein
MAKFSSVGFMRRAAAKHNSLTLALVAKQQEKSNANEALNLLDKAISIYALRATTWPLRSDMIIHL